MEKKSKITFQLQPTPPLHNKKSKTKKKVDTTKKHGKKIHTKIKISTNHTYSSRSWLRTHYIACKHTFARKKECMAIQRQKTQKRQKNTKNKN